MLILGFYLYLERDGGRWWTFLCSCDSVRRPRGQKCESDAVMGGGVGWGGGDVRIKGLEKGKDWRIGLDNSSVM